MKNVNSGALAWTNVGGDPNNNPAKFIDVSNWLPPENIPQNYSVPKNFPNRNPGNDAFTNSIIRVFAGEPKRVAPPIQNQKSGQSMLDFLGRGFAIQGPANHSQPLTFRHQKPSVNQKSFLDFATNPFASPSSTIVAPKVDNSNDRKSIIIYC